MAKIQITPQALGPKKLVVALNMALNMKRPTFVAGSPGVGKSDIIKQIARDRGLKLIDLRASQMAPEDFLGLPYAAPGAKLATYLPMDNIPLEGTELPQRTIKGKPAVDENGKPILYKGYLLFLDELNSAGVEVQAAAYRLLLDREIGSHKIHPDTAILAAGNHNDDGAITNKLSSAVISRMGHLSLEVSADDWLAWTDTKKGKPIHSKVIAYLSFKKDALHDFDKTSARKKDTSPYACPRTWEFTSDLMHEFEALTGTTKPNYNDPIFRAMLNGYIGSVQASAFSQFLEYFSKVPSLAAFLKDPDAIPLKLNDREMTYANTCFLCDAIENAQDLEIVSTYIQKVPADIRVLFIRSMRKKSLISYSMDKNTKIGKVVASVAALMKD
jgi:hypothetical protein